MYSLVLRIGYKFDEDSILQSLNSIAINKFTTEDLKDALKRGILIILPKAGPINTSEAVEAYRAAEAVLRSL